MRFKKGNNINFSFAPSKFKASIFFDWFKQEKIGILTILAIISISFLLYFKSIHFGYTYLDDTALLLNRAEFLKDLGNIFKSFGKNVFYLAIQNSSYYRPMLTVSFILDTFLFGSNMAAYHLMNISLHIISSIILFHLLKKVLKSQKTASFLTILFVAHPALMQGVVWIPGRNDILLVIFSFLSFDYFLNLMEKREAKDMFFFLFFFLSALFTKETAFLLPLIFISYFFLFPRRKLIRKDYLFFFFIVCIPFLFAFLVRNQVLGNISFNSRSAIKSIVGNGLSGTLFYLGKVFYPVHIGVMSVLKRKVYWSGIISIFFLAFLILTTAKSERKYSYFGIFWFVIFLLPVFISTRRFGNLIVFEHRLYLPLFGVLLALGVNNFFKKALSFKFYYLILVVYVFFCFLIVGKNIDNFKDGISFWNKAYKDNPEDSMSIGNLGLVYLKNEEYEKSIEMYRLVLAKDPTSKISRYNIGIVYASMGMYGKARDKFEEEISLFPNSSLGYFGLAKLYQEENDFKRAEENYLKVIKISPDSVKAYMNLAIMYSKQGRMEEAIKMYKEVKKRGVEY